MFLNSEVEANLYSAHVTYQNMKEMLFPIVVTLSLLNIILSSAIITIFVFYASFRIAGPLYRFNAAIKEISEGNLKPLLTLRDKDELVAFSESLQEMADTFIDNIERSRLLSSRLKEINKECKNQELEELIETLDKALSGFNA